MIISNEGKEDIMKIVKSLEYSGWIIKGTSETIENETKEGKGGFTGILLEAVDASLLGNLLTSKGETVASRGWRVIRAAEGSIATSWGGRGTTTAGQNFELQKHRLILKYKNIIKMNSDLTVLIQEMIYLL